MTNRELHLGLSALRHAAVRVAATEGARRILVLETRRNLRISGGRYSEYGRMGTTVRDTHDWVLGETLFSTLGRNTVTHKILDSNIDLVFRKEYMCGIADTRRYIAIHS